MTDNYTGFLRHQTSNLYKVNAKKVAPESLLATECLVHKLYELRHLVQGNVLDIGCSTKPYKPLFEDKYLSYIGVDVPFSDHTKAYIDVFSRAEHLPFQKASFDTILLTEVLEHVPDPQQALNEICRVMRPGGTAIISVPFMYRIHEAPYDYFRYTPFSMKHMAERAQLHLKKVVHRGGYITVFADTANKGSALLLGAIRRGLKLSPTSAAGKSITAVQRLFLTPLQKLQWALLQKESLASERYTLGFVFVLQKPVLQQDSSGSADA
jgi:SAM-dependent methyltransferase